MLKILIMLVLSALAVLSQQTTTSTTLSTALSSTTNAEWCIGSATGVVLNSTSGNASYLFVDREAAQITSQGSTSTCYKVKRAQLGTSQQAHAAASKVWVGQAATGTGDSSRPFTGAFTSSLPAGLHGPARYTLPIICGPRQRQASSVINCIGSRWSGQADKTFFVSPANCTFAPTTLTTTNTLIQVGASAVYV
jgi:hypothetical protein